MSPDGNLQALREYECRPDHSSTIDRITDDLMNGERVRDYDAREILQYDIDFIGRVLKAWSSPEAKRQDLTHDLQSECRALVYQFVVTHMGDAIQEREEEEHET